MRCPTPLAEGVVLVSHHVDGLVVSCAIAQVPMLVSAGSERLDSRLELARSTARRARPSLPVETGLTWPHGPDGIERLRVAPYSPRGRYGYPYAVESTEWLMLIGHLGPAKPRFLFQFRSAALLARGAADSFALTRDWWISDVLPLLGGVPDGEEPQWRISRVDIAADVAGVSLTAADVDRFTSRSTNRTLYDNREQWQAEEGRR